MLRLLLLLLPLTACLSSTPPPPRLPNPDVDVLHYIFALNLSDASDEIIGEATINVQFRADGLTAIDLDLIGEANRGMTIDSIQEDGQTVSFQHRAHRIHITTDTPTRVGETRTYTVTYRGQPEDGLIISTNKHGDRTFFGDNWPNRARHWLPTVDHPSDKALCEFIVTAPDHYQVVANGMLVEQTDLLDNLRLTHWRSTVPLPTKVMVVGVARFAIQHVDDYQGVPIQSWVYPQDREAGFYDFALAEPILQYFTDQIGPFPYAKLANVQSKTRYGGMENASTIFYNENAIQGTRQNETLLAHEIAHQWFGDSVTEKDWHHIWLSEGFATYFAQLYLENAYGRDRLVEGMTQTRNNILAYFEDEPNSPVVDTSITDLNDLLNTNSYQKGGWVLHMLRRHIGDDAFWTGIRDYYEQYRDSNALTEDFLQIMEHATGQDLDWFFEQWIYQPGQPAYEGTWHYDSTAKNLTVALNQVQTDGTFFTMPIELAIHTNSTTHLEVLTIDKRANTFTLPLDEAPTEVVLDPNQWVLMQADFSRR